MANPTLSIPETMWALYFGPKHPNHWKAVDESWHMTPVQAHELLMFTYLCMAEATPEFKEPLRLFEISLRSKLKSVEPCRPSKPPKPC